jgi:hypothetical protein
MPAPMYNPGMIRFYKRALLVLALSYGFSSGAFASDVADGRAGLEKYHHPERVFSFEYPDDWGLFVSPRSVTVQPADAVSARGPTCVMRAEESPGAIGAPINTMIETMVEKQILIAMISVTYPGAKNFDIQKYPVANTLTQRITFSRGDGADEIKAAMILTYNTVTGHKLDMICFAPAASWYAGAGMAFEKIQSSLLVWSGLGAGEDEEPDVLGNNMDIVLKYTNEMKGPALPLEIARRVVSRGIVSALAGYCGFDWEAENFKPFIAQEEEKETWSQEQIDSIRALHETVRADVVVKFEQSGPCNKNDLYRTGSLLRALDVNQ